MNLNETAFKMRASAKAPDNLRALHWFIAAATSMLAAVAIYAAAVFSAQLPADATPSMPDWWKYGITCLLLSATAVGIAAFCLRVIAGNFEAGGKVPLVSCILGVFAIAVYCAGVALGWLPSVHWGCSMALWPLFAAFLASCVPFVVGNNGPKVYLGLLVLLVLSLISIPFIAEGFYYGFVYRDTLVMMWMALTSIAAFLIVRRDYLGYAVRSRTVFLCALAVVALGLLTDQSLQHALVHPSVLGRWVEYRASAFIAVIIGSSNIMDGPSAADLLCYNPIVGVRMVAGMPATVLVTVLLALAAVGLVQATRLSTAKNQGDSVRKTILRVIAFSFALRMIIGLIAACLALTSTYICPLRMLGVVDFPLIVAFGVTLCGMGRSKQVGNESALGGNPDQRDAEDADKDMLDGEADEVANRSTIPAEAEGESR